MTGIFTAEQEKKLAALLDEAVKLKGFAELLDGHLFKALITFVDDTFVDKLDEEVKTQLSGLATACLNEDVDEATVLAADLLNSLIDIPVLEEGSEALIFKGAVELIVAAVLKWIESKRAE
jgi:hypothetical protein